jgi:hypothetical protein
MNFASMSFAPKSLAPKTEKIFQGSFLLVFLLAALVASVGADKKSAPAAPRAAAPKAAPARPATTRPPTNRPATNRPATTNRPGAAGTRPGTAAGTRPGAARTGAGTMNRNGNAGRTGAGTPMGRNGGTNAGRGGAGSVSKVNRPLPGKQVSLRGGGTASIRPNGQIRSINRNGMHIEHGINGSRHIESTHNGARVVTTGRNSGYVQRPYVTRGGRTYVSRTVVINHVSYTSVYRSYSYGGYCCYYGYHPAFYYGAAYYGWAYNPWPAPVYWGWGWGGSPWYGYYGGYFAPYPTYPSAAFWLTDYLIAANLQAAYAAQAAANAAAAGGAAASAGGGGGDQQGDNSGGGDAPAASGGAVTLTPEVKAMIAEEVKAQLAAEQASASQPAAADGQAAGQSGGSAQPQQASGEVPPALDPARRTFVVDTDLTVASDGQECTLTGGDVITRITDTPDDDRKVTVSVASSKKADCAPGKQVAVGVDDLQEMHNHFQEQLDNGMKEMAAKQGTGGLPKAPDTKTTASDVPPPPPDASAAKALDDQQTAADQTESQVVKEAFSQGS